MKYLICIVGLLMNCAFLSAQTYYYDVAGELSVENATYVCELTDYGWVTLHNKQITYGQECPQVYTDGNKPVDDSTEPSEPWLIDDQQMFHVCDSIWLTTTAPYVSKKEAKDTMIELYIDSQTGKVVDVIYGFRNDAAVATMPPSVYRKVEQLLKEKLNFKVAAAGKKVNYIYMMYD